MRFSQDELNGVVGTDRTIDEDFASSKADRLKVEWSCSRCSSSLLDSTIIVMLANGFGMIRPYQDIVQVCCLDRGDEPILVS